MTLQIQNFDCIDEVLGLLEADIPSNPFITTTSRSATCQYEWVSEPGAMTGKLIPTLTSPFWSPFLYRGQVERHVPCLPGVFRGFPLVDHPRKLARSDRARLLLLRVRLEEFVEAMKQHPAYAYSEGIGLELMHYALAQHYEMITDRIDLTQDHEVAAFFATNRREEDGQWRPVSHGTGVIYRLVIEDFLEHQRKTKSDGLDWIGKQVFPRPGEQKAWTFHLPLGLDFEALPIEVFTFTHRESSGRRLNEKFGGGQALFPPDPLQEIADAIKVATSIPRSTLRRVLTLQGCPPEIHDQEIDATEAYLKNDLGVETSDRPPLLFSLEQLREARVLVASMREAFLADTGVRVVRHVTAAETETLVEHGSLCLLKAP